MSNLGFENNNYKLLFEIAGEKIYLTDTLISTWVIMGVLILVAIIVRIWLPRFKEVPTGLQNVVESAVEAIDNFTLSTMGKGYEHFAGYFFSIFAFIIFSNFSGLFLLRAPTADLATTAALALMTFVITHFVGFHRQKFKHIKGFVSPNVVFLPINLVSEISDIVSLCLRLFGNMLGGTIILALVYEMLPRLLTLVLPAALHAYFDVFSGALQAYVFTLLSMTMITQKGSPYD